MDKKSFKKAITDVLDQLGYKKNGKTYFLKTDELISIIGLQKSNYGNDYYVNFGFLIKSINPEIEIPNEHECDVFGRLSFQNEGEKLLSIPFESLDEDKFVYLFKQAYETTLLPSIKFGLSQYFEKYPKAKCMASAQVKKYLNLE